MALPSVDKTWMFSVNNPVGNKYTGEVDGKDFLYKLVTILKSFGWTVWGSCDGSTYGNGDGVDRWTSTSKIVFGYTRSWIVLVNSNLTGAAKSSICIDCYNGGGNAAFYGYFSLTGFGSANGGANGNTGAAPTAASATSWTVIDNYGMTPYDVPNQCSLHVMQSTDMKCTRIFVTSHAYRSANALVSYLCVEEVKDPAPEWTTPIFTMSSNWNGGYSLDQGNLTNANTLVKSKNGSTTLALFFTCPYANSAFVPASTTLANSDDNSSEFPIYPIGLMCTTVGHRNWQKGQVFDMWWGHYSVPPGTHYPETPVGSLRKFVQLGRLIFPWDGLVTPDGTPMELR